MIGITSKKQVGINTTDQHNGASFLRCRSLKKNTLNVVFTIPPCQFNRGNNMYLSNLRYKKLTKSRRQVWWLTRKLENVILVKPDTTSN